MLKNVNNKSQKLFLRKKRRNRYALLVANRIAQKPRLSVFRSGKHIYAQIIDDKTSKTLASASTVVKDISKRIKGSTSGVEAAKIIGEVIAEKAIKADIKEVVFDRGAYIFHGRVKALADSARQKGLKI